MRMTVVLAYCLFQSMVPGQSSCTSGEILVGPKPGMGPALIEYYSRFGLRIVEKDAISGVMRLSVPEGSEHEWIDIISRDPKAAYAERNGIGGGGTVPNDTFFTSQWHLRNTGQSGGTPGADIEATAAWDITTGSSSIVVAILDTGIDSNHPELAVRIAPGGYDFVNEDINPEDDNGHGTQVAGVLGARSQNGFGVTGVDWNCKILPLKVLNQSNSGTSMDLAQALNFVATVPSVQIVSMSLVGYSNDITLENALAAASAAGKILIACASNTATNNPAVSYPGSSPLTISIGATTRTDSRASFSGTGLALDFVAPGDSIVTTKFGTSMNTTSTVSGCSMSTPIAAGVVSLILARVAAVGMPMPTQAEVYQLLAAGAEDLVGPPTEDTPGRDNFFGWGRINSRRTIELISALGPCSQGNTGVGSGGPFDVLRVNGAFATSFDRRIAIGLTEPMAFSVAVPPSNPTPTSTPSHFIIFGKLGIPTTADESALPFFVGNMCFAPALAVPQADLFTLVDSYDATQSILFATPAPWTGVIPGLNFPLTFTLQGVIVDTPMNHVAVTNAVIADVKALPPPIITTIFPPAAYPGTSVTISGSGFRSGTTLFIGGMVVTPTLMTAQSIVFTAPPVGCNATLTITNPDSLSDSAMFNQTVISSVFTPQGTSAAGGKIVAVIGSGFLPGSTVTIGGNAMSISSISTATIIGISPPGIVGPQTLVVTTPLGCVGMTTYTYTP